MDAFNQFYVVKNTQGIYSIFPAELITPIGWELVSQAMTKQECLDEIEKLWANQTKNSTGE